MKKWFTPRNMTYASVIAAVYAAVTLLLAPISYGQVQLRVAEALTLLPIMTPAAIPGLFVGCLIANLMGGATLIDVVFGSLATLGAAFLTYFLRKRPVLAALPPVIVNAVVIGLVLHLTIDNLPFWLAALSVGGGQALACFALGLPLLWALRRVMGQEIL
ncbi:MAG: QueT transporter family protein [Clostridia bacterium]